MFSSHQYPQREFAKAILGCLKNEKAVLIDAPCGNGETAYLLSSLNKLKVMGYDISERSIEFAKKIFERANLEYKTADIMEVFRLHKEVNYFCMINSLFLLPKQDEIIQKIHKVLASGGEVFFIIPNTDGINYSNFRKNNAQVNSLELSKDDFIRYIEPFGFKLKIIKPLCYANVYGRKELNYFSVLAPFYLRLLNFFMSRVQAGTPSYFLIGFEKNQNDSPEPR